MIRFYRLTAPAARCAPALGRVPSSSLARFRHGGPLARLGGHWPLNENVFHDMTRQMEDIFRNVPLAGPLLRTVARDFPALKNLAGANAPAGASLFSPTCDVREDDTAIVVEAELPGCKKEDIKVSLEGDVLRLSGEVKTEKDETDEKTKWHRIERSYGSFERTIPLPDYAKKEEIKASYDNGVLRLTIPKEPKALEQKEQPKTISIE
jgi:HSP20 family protein